MSAQQLPETSPEPLSPSESSSSSEFEPEPPSPSAIQSIVIEVEKLNQDKPNINDESTNNEPKIAFEAAQSNKRRIRKLYFVTYMIVFIFQGTQCSLPPTMFTPFKNDLKYKFIILFFIFLTN